MKWLQPTALRRPGFHVLPRTFRGKLAAAIGLLVAAFLAIALGLQIALFGRIYDQATYRVIQVVRGGTIPTPDSHELYVSTTGCWYTSHSVGCGPLTPGAIMEINGDDVRQPVLQSAMWFSLILFAAFALLAVVAAWLISKRLAGRISSLGEQMQRLDPADLTGRVALTGTDEVAALAGDVNAMLERIERSASAQRQFIANASHELRTPIAVIETSLDAPLAQGRFPADVEPSVRRALDADRDAGELIEELLELSRVQNRMPRLGEVALGGIVERTLDAQWDAIDAHGLDVRTAIDRTVTAQGDAAMLALLVGNLMRNAVVHNVECGTIDVTVARRDGHAVLFVGNSTEPVGTDTADKTSAAALDDLFIPFHRGDESRLAGRPGNGLGLSIVREVADAHRARVTLARPRPDRFEVTVRF